MLWRISGLTDTEATRATEPQPVAATNAALPAPGNAPLPVNRA